ncbi:MAG: RNase H family protein [Candidatus Thorarchaeota archaeon]
MKIFVDGSGKSGKFCYIVEGRQPKILKESGITNNQAEYKAIIAALQDVKEKDIEIYSDSQLAVRQLTYEYSIKEDHLRELANKVWNLCEGRNVKFFWIPRSKNKAGKVLG